MAISDARAAQISVAKDAVLKSLRQMEKRLPERMKDDFTAWGRHSMRRFVVQRLSGGQGLRRRTGALSKSFRAKTSGEKLKDIQTRFMTTSKYAPALEEGRQNVRAKHGGRDPHLAIPLPGSPVLTRAGVYRPNQGPLRKTLPAFFGPAWSFFAAKGVLFGSKKLATKSNIYPLFALKRSVDIPPRLKFYKTITGYFKVLYNRMQKSAGDVTGG